MMKQTTRQELETVIRARYSVIQVVSPEEGRVLADLRGICAGLNAALFTWSVSRGFRREGGKSTESMEACRDPMKAIDAACKDGSVPGVFVFCDFHPYLANDQGAVRRLREGAVSLRDGGKNTIILLGPVSKLPPELEKDVYVIDYDLPSRMEIEKLVTRFMEDNKLAADNVNQVVDAAVGLTLVEADNALAKSHVMHSKLVFSTIAGEKKQILKKSGLLEFCDSDEDAGSVGGHGDVKEWLRKRAKALGTEAREFGLPAPKGVLFVGPPGSGKSLLAKVTSSIFGVPLIRFDVGKVFGGLVGQSEQNIRQVIKVAEACAPCCLWIDELEKGFAGTSGAGDSGTSSRVFGAFLQWMQDHKAPVFVVATANNVKQLPPELLRKGRFDEIWFADLPTDEEREQIFAIHLKKAKRDPGKFSMPHLVGATPGFTGAEIEQLVVSGLYEAFDRGAELTTDMLIEEAGDVKPLSIQMEKEITAMREWGKENARPTAKPQEKARRPRGRQIMA